MYLGSCFAKDLAFKHNKMIFGFKIPQYAFRNKHLYSFSGDILINCLHVLSDILLVPNGMVLLTHNQAWTIMFGGQGRPKEEARS